eukprot:CAMPEP_0202861370 /NCGR_PEP_ID=MMETSP1391-20130828/2794_1 /ASSEMBLY_ACC=CAM_ASM_000867 /TAXON_ID=1034604 /ORGANISM="Chlamydomonas leiostraca, Strain SAG 11-49" /LENGTH=1112 /DNA_ID=CAMNT_0049540753 /DNA_START=150 /DNA_END=3489 /DNA_ORIENTATION=-
MGLAAKEELVRSSVPHHALCRRHAPRVTVLARSQPYRPAQGGGPAYGSSYGANSQAAAVRRAVLQQLAGCRDWRSVAQVVSSYGEVLSAQDIARIIAATPRMAPPAPPAAPPALTAMQIRALGPWRAQQYQAARQADYEQAVQEQQQYIGMMQGLAAMSQSYLGQYAPDELAEMIYALSHAGAMDEGTAAGFLSHASKAASAGQLDVNGLAGVLTALASAGYRPSPSTLSSLVGDVNALGRCSTPGELSATLSALARLGYQPEPQQLQETMVRLGMVRLPPSQQAQQASRQPVQQPVQEEEEEGEDETEVGEAEDDAEAARDEEAFQKVAAAVRALERAGARAQAAALRDQYMRQLQARAQARAQRRAARAEAARRTKAEAEAAARAKAQAQAAAQARAQAEAEAKARAQAQRQQEVLRAQVEARERELAAAREQQEREAAAARDARVRQAIAHAVASTPTWQQLRVLLSTYPTRLTAGDLATMLARLPALLSARSSEPLTWRQRAEVVEMLEELAGLLCQRLAPAEDRQQRQAQQEEQEGMSPDSLVSALSSMVELRWTSSAAAQALLGALLRTARNEFGSFQAADMLRLMGVLRSAGLRPTAAWMDALATASAGKLAGCDADQLPSFAAAFLRLGHDPGAAWLAAYLRALEGLEDTISQEQATAALRAAAAIDADAVRAWYARVMSARQGRAQPESAGRAKPPPATKRPDAQQRVFERLSHEGSSAGAVLQGNSASELPDELVADLLGQGVVPPSPAATASKQAPGSAKGQQQASKPPPSSATTSGASKGGASASAAAADTSAPRSSQAASQATPLDSVEFDEEAAGAAEVFHALQDGQEPPMGWAQGQTQQASAAGSSQPAGASTGGGLLLDRMADLGEGVLPDEEPVRDVSDADDSSTSTAFGASGSGSAQPAQAQQQQQPASAAQVRALKSALLERLEVVESYGQEMEARNAPYRQRAENAAIQVAAVRDQTARLQADYDRVKARHSAEKEALGVQARAEVVQRFLPLLDNMERALAALPPKTDGERAVHDAYQAALGMPLKELMMSCNIVETPGVGSAFDPSVHDAIMQEVDTSVPDGTVLQVLQKGYQHKEGPVIRAALVKVSSC